jgi:hypothetical protein
MLIPHLVSIWIAASIRMQWIAEFLETEDWANVISKSSLLQGDGAERRRHHQGGPRLRRGWGWRHHGHPTPKGTTKRSSGVTTCHNILPGLLAPRATAGCIGTSSPDLMPPHDTMAIDEKRKLAERDHCVTLFPRFSTSARIGFVTLPLVPTPRHLDFDSCFREESRIRECYAA